MGERSSPSPTLKDESSIAVSRTGGRWGALDWGAVTAESGVDTDEEELAERGRSRYGESPPSAASCEFLFLLLDTEVKEAREGFVNSRRRDGRLPRRPGLSGCGDVSSLVEVLPEKDRSGMERCFLGMGEAGAREGSAVLSDVRDSNEVSNVSCFVSGRGRWLREGGPDETGVTSESVDDEVRGGEKTMP